MISKKKLNQIIHLARKCNDCAMSFFDCFEKNKINYKIDYSPVTKADLEVNKLAVNGLQRIFTNTKSLAKEFLKILIFEYFGFLKIGFDVFFTLIPNHPACRRAKMQP